MNKDFKKLRDAVLKAGGPSKPLVAWLSGRRSRCE
jgi:hypothetical protein